MHFGTSVTTFCFFINIQALENSINMIYAQEHTMSLLDHPVKPDDDNQTFCILNFAFRILTAPCSPLTPHSSLLPAPCSLLPGSDLLRKVQTRASGSHLLKTARSDPSALASLLPDKYGK